MPPQALIVLCLVGALLLSLRFLGLGRGLHERFALRGPRLKDLDKMDGLAFEDWLARRLKQGGFQVERTAKGGDFGVDLVALGAGVRIGIEAKRRGMTVSNAVIRSVATGCAHHDCPVGAVITQSRYSREARQQAQSASVPVILVDRSDLLDLPRVLWDAVRRLH